MKIRKSVFALVILAAFPGVALAATGGENADKRMKDRFDRLDENGDGRIDREEFKARGKLLFGKMDTNADGVLTKADLEDRERAERAAKRLERMDENGDGKVSKEEFAAAGAKMFKRLDENDDGYLTKGEMEKRRHAADKDRKRDENRPEAQN